MVIFHLNLTLLSEYPNPVPIALIRSYILVFEGKGLQQVEREPPLHAQYKQVSHKIKITHY